MIVAAVIAVTAVVAAGVLATADGALLTTHTSPDHAADPKAVRNERERTHRALAMARVIAYLAAGAALAQLGYVQSLNPLARLSSEVVVAIAIVAVTEGAGRAIAQARPAESVAALRPFTALVIRVLSPLATLGASIERVIQAVLPTVPDDDEQRETSTDQFREVVAAEAEISVAEEALIHGVFTMGDTEVHEIMVPRVDIVGIELTTPWSEVVDRVRSSEHARLPVFDETLDNITGFLYAKDLLADVVREDDSSNDEWRRLIRPAPVIPTSKRIDTQLREFQASRTHMAIVTDEYGGTAGLVTIEDILEEIVGEIRDEYDLEESDIEQEGRDRFWVAGRVSLDDLAERLKTDFDVEDVSTVGGLVYELFGRVPAGGEAVMRGGFRIVVERVRRRRIERVYFERVDPLRSEEPA